MEETTDLRIRRYQQEDEGEVRCIAADTAFFGEPVEVYLDDRELFCDLFYAYYTSQEAGHGWVATRQGGVVGFLMGCAEPQRKGRRWMRSIPPLVARRAMQGRYPLGRKTWRYALSLFKAYVRGELPRPDLSGYPAHLHINVEAKWRGHGLGQRLMQAYFDQLRSEGVRGVHLMTTNQNAAACRLYAKMGFRLLEAKPTRLWSAWIPEPVENRCYGLVLSEANAELRFSSLLKDWEGCSLEVLAVL